MRSYPANEKMNLAIPKSEFAYHSVGIATNIEYHSV
jgi:hypothetical protein